MKRLYRKMMIAIAGVLMLGTASVADAKSMDIKQFPAAAQQMIHDNFSGRKVAMSKSGTSMLFIKNYDVVFTNGDKVEFDHNGNWTEIQCNHSSVPAALVPQGIRDYVKRNYAGTSIKEIEKSGGKYEIKLSNGLDIKFDKYMEVVDIDN